MPGGHSRDFPFWPGQRNRFDARFLEGGPPSVRKRLSFCFRQGRLTELSLWFFGGGHDMDPLRERRSSLPSGVGLF